MLLKAESEAAQSAQATNAFSELEQAEAEWISATAYVNYHLWMARQKYLACQLNLLPDMSKQGSTFVESGDGEKARGEWQDKAWGLVNELNAAAYHREHAIGLKHSIDLYTQDKPWSARQISRDRVLQERRRRPESSRCYPSTAASSLLYGTAKRTEYGWIASHMSGQPRRGQSQCTPRCRALPSAVDPYLPIQLRQTEDGSRIKWSGNTNPLLPNWLLS